MPFTIGCPHCHRPLTVTEQMAGKVVTCPHCRQALSVPPPVAPPPPAGNAGGPAARGREVERKDPPPPRQRSWGCVLGFLAAVLGATALGCGGCFLFLGGGCLALTKKLNQAVPKARKHEREGTGRADTNPRLSVQILDLRVSPFRTPAGIDTQILYVDWKNTGNRPVRTVDATIRGHDDRGNSWVIGVPGLTIYAVFQTDPGVAPGETHIAQPGQEGRILLDLNHPPPSRVTVEITNVSEDGIK